MEGSARLDISVESLSAEGVTFAQAMQRLEALGKALEQGTIELEELKHTVHEMDVLVRFCAQKIGLARTEIESVVAGWKPLLSTLNEQD